MLDVGFSRKMQGKSYYLCKLNKQTICRKEPIVTVDTVLWTNLAAWGNFGSNGLIRERLT